MVSNLDQQAPRRKKIMNLHEDIPKVVNKVFTTQWSDLGSGSNPWGPLRPLGPPRYFGLRMVNPCKPPLPPNRPYC